MLTITDCPKKIPGEIHPRKEGNPLRAREKTQKPIQLPVDEVVLQKREENGVNDDEYLVATYWG